MEDDMKNYTNIVNNINNIINTRNKEEININDLKINDYIYIDFIPDSQKYIYDLTPKLGIISSIINNNDEIDNIPNITILNYNGVYENILHDYCSYYGTSLGYTYTIFLIKN